MVDHSIEGAIVDLSSVKAPLTIPAMLADRASKGGAIVLTKVAALNLGK
ncbi:MAG: hypothetical protein AAF943_06385 [Pseudomonadota bacterium]